MYRLAFREPSLQYNSIAMFKRASTSFCSQNGAFERGKTTWNASVNVRLALERWKHK